MAGTSGGVCGLLSGFLLSGSIFRRSVRPCGRSFRRGAAPGAGILCRNCFFLRGSAGGGIGRLLRDRGGLYGLYSAAAPWSSACLFLFPCDRASLSDGVLCAGSGALCDLFLHRGRSQPGTAGVYASGRCSGGGDSASVRVALPASVCGTAGIDYLHADGTPAESDLRCFCAGGADCALHSADDRAQP